MFIIHHRHIQFNKYDSENLFNISCSLKINSCSLKNPLCASMAALQIIRVLRVSFLRYSADVSFLFL